MHTSRMDVLTDRRRLAKLYHLPQTHSGSREVGIMADRVHEPVSPFPRHTGDSRGKAFRPRSECERDNAGEEYYGMKNERRINSSEQSES